MSLVITPHLPAILEIIKNNEVSQVNAATGSGKSIGVIKALGEAGYRVFVSVPTRVSATSLSEFLYSLNPELDVGFAAEGVSHYNSHTQIVYATSGHVRRKLLNYFSNWNPRLGLSFTDILVLDETHSGSLDNTVILSLWTEARKRNAPVPKLVLLSATPTDIPIEPKPIVHPVPVPSPFPVEIIYDPPDFDETPNDHAARLAVDLHLSNTIKGDFLIFVAGAKDADEIVSYIQKNLEDDVLALPAYSNLDSTELHKIYEPSDVRKIVVATNIAESSITIDGLTVVIDTLLCKEAVSSNSGALRLEEIKITKDSAKQRAGRVGRTAPGICYRISTEDEYEKLENHRDPEVQRVPLYNTVMEFLKANVDPYSIIDADDYKIENSLDLLISLNLIEKRGEKIYVLPAGNFVPTVPLGIRNATFLWKWLKAGYSLYQGCVIACLIDVHNNGYFYFPRKRRDQSPADYNMAMEEYIDLNFRKWIGETPLHTYLNMWNDLTTQSGRNHFRLVSEPWTYNYRNWSNKNHINYKQLTEFVTILSQTYRVIRSAKLFPIDVNIVTFDTNAILTRAAPFLKDVYSDLIMKRILHGDYIHPISGYQYTFDRRRIISKIEREKPNQIIPLSVHEVTTKSGKILGFLDIVIST